MKKNDLKQAELKFIKRNLELYNENKELILLYDVYIQKIAELFGFIMNDNSDLFFSIVFDILIEIGFFSANRTFITEKEFSEFTLKPGMSIICGSGECRNIACFYEDVFSFFYNYPLKLCCIDLKGLVNNDTLTYGNHVINLVKYNDIMYGYDLLNHVAFKPIDTKILKGINIDYTLQHKPNGDLLLYLTTILNSNINFISTINNKRAFLQESAKSNILSKDSFKKLVYDANEFISERKKLLQHFMLENEELTHEIKKKMLSLKLK